MTMDAMKKGQRCRINALPDDSVRSQAVRFGIGEGEIVICAEIIPAGPVIISKNRQEIAIGRRLARKILVEAV